VPIPKENSEEGENGTAVPFFSRPPGAVPFSPWQNRQPGKYLAEGVAINYT
jgi:hypothetical protein